MFVPMIASNPIPNSTPAKRTRKPKPPPPQPPFRFRHLPLEIRNKIYHLCLVDEKEIAIEAEEVLDWDGNILEKDEEIYNEDLPVRLVQSRPSWKPKQPSLDVNLLLVDKATHQEATTVVYGSNEFQFYNRYPWRNLQEFMMRLRSSGYKSLRRIDVEFPEISRYVRGSMVKAQDLPTNVMSVMKTVRRLPKLDTLTFRVHDDIMSSDLDIIQWISKHQGKSKIRLNIKMASIWDGKGGREDRLVRVSAAAVELFNDCNWEVVGDFERVDSQHRFWKQVRWLRWLQENWRNERLPELRAREEWF